jgi:methylenetetrahydrofolate dehydrogenase (NADP+)/methenyltetrahydrofolate cyclohydrolase
MLGKISALNDDDSISGLILQMPLPPQIDARKVQVAISPAKDVEGMHPENMGRLLYGGGVVAPCTPMAAVTLLTSACGTLAGKEAVIVGHSEIVGKPIAMMLLASPDASPTVTVCHIATRDLAWHTARAEVLIVAAGVSQARWQGYSRRKKAGKDASLPDLSPLVKADMLKKGAIVIDVAINRIPKGFDAAGEPLKDDKGRMAMQTVGDVEFDAALDKVEAITPVPGGVGPVTVAMLLKNTIACAKAIGG